MTTKRSMTASLAFGAAFAAVWLGRHCLVAHRRSRQMDERRAKEALATFEGEGGSIPE